MEHIQLSRSHANDLFVSWKLGGDLATNHHSIQLHERVVEDTTPEDADVDYVHAYNSAFHNHISAAGAQRFAFVRSQEGGLDLLRLDIDGDIPAVHIHAFLNETPPLEKVSGSPLYPTVAEVAGVPAGRGVTTPPLLTSSGHGDLRLVVTDSREGCASPSAPCFPLHPTPPLQGVRPFQLLAALNVNVGDQEELNVVALAWAVVRGGERSPSRCEVFALRLTADPADHLGALIVRGVELLRVGRNSFIPGWLHFSFYPISQLLNRWQRAADRGSILTQWAKKLSISFPGSNPRCRRSGHWPTPKLMLSSSPWIPGEQGLLVVQEEDLWKLEQDWQQQQFGVPAPQDQARMQSAQGRCRSPQKG
jgi:hypothetical protein